MALEYESDKKWGIKDFSFLRMNANEKTGFYMKCNTGVKWVKFITAKIKFLEDSCEFVKMLYKIKCWKGTQPAFTCSKLTIEN